MNNETWIKLTKKYGVMGYTDTMGIIPYKHLLKLLEKAEKLDQGERVWVPRGYYSQSKIKDDDISMMILEDEE